MVVKIKINTREIQTIIEWSYTCKLLFQQNFKNVCNTQITSESKTKSVMFHVFSSFKRAIRTKNDAEGQHSRIHKRERCNNVRFTELLHLIHKEAALIPLKAALLSQGLLKRKKNSTKTIQQQVFSNWKTHESTEKIQTTPTIYLFNANKST